MVLETPARPPLESELPEMAEYRRLAVRLHPRTGQPTAYQSSLGGPILLELSDEWPMCSAAHRGVPNIATSASQDLSGVAEPMVPGLQLWRRDVPELPFRAAEDLCQVMWCPLLHGAEWEPRVAIYWRSLGEGVDKWAIATAPNSSPYVNEYYVPRQCTIAPERIADYASRFSLPEHLRSEYEAWSRLHGYEFPSQSGPAPGTKIQGWPDWSDDEPGIECAQGHQMRLLLTVASVEFDRNSRAVWKPIGDPAGVGQDDAGLSFGDLGNMFVLICNICADRPIVTVMQG